MRVVLGQFEASNNQTRRGKGALYIKNSRRIYHSRRTRWVGSGEAKRAGVELKEV